MIEDNAERMDIMFYNSLKKVRRQYSKYLSYHTIKTILLSIFLGLYYKDNHRDTFFNSFIFAVVVGGCYMVIYTFILIKLFSPQECLEIARSFQHVGKEPFGVNVAIEDQINSNIATVYDFNNPDILYTDEQKHQIETSFEEVIAQTIMQEQCLIRSGISILNMCSLALIIYFIYNVATVSTTPTQKGVIITYIVLQSLSKIQTLFLLLLLALCPIIMLVVCCICCCCRTSEQQQNQIPEIPCIEFTPNMRLQDNECKICYQNFANKDKIKILPCSNKHIFHDFCISSWFKVANTCPLCRRQMSQFSNGNNANNQMPPVSSSSGEQL